MKLNLPAVASALLLVFSLASPLEAEVFERHVNLSGQPASGIPGWVTNGDPQLTGTAVLTYDTVAGTLDFDIQLENDRYAVTQVHIYEVGADAQGDSEYCWGGRWSSHDFLFDTGFGVSSGRISGALNNPENWFFMVHTEGGHFANDGGGLIPYNSAVHETQADWGVTESGARFNNRVGRTLDDLLLREMNPVSGSFPNSVYPDPNHFLAENDQPFPDAIGNMWLESDGGGGWQLTSAAISAGYDLETEYLFYRYDDQGPSWDYGGPEGAAGGFLTDPDARLDGDLDFDKDIDIEDWLQFADGVGRDMTGMTDEESYPLGDLNGDQMNNYYDFLAFQIAYEDFNPGSSFAEMIASVPEPSSLMLFALALLGVVCPRRRSSITMNVNPQ